MKSCWWQAAHLQLLSNITNCFHCWNQITVARVIVEKKEAAVENTFFAKKNQYLLVSCISDKVAARRVFDVGLNCNCCEHQEPGLKCSAFKFKWVFVWGLLFKFKVILLSIICFFFFKKVPVEGLWQMCCSFYVCWRFFGSFILESSTKYEQVTVAITF